MKSLSSRWNAIGAQIGAGMVERWEYFAPRWAVEARAAELDPFRDVAAKFAALRTPTHSARVFRLARPGHTRRFHPSNVPPRRHAA